MAQNVTHKLLTDVELIAQLKSSDSILLSREGHFQRMPASIITELLNHFITDEDGNVYLSGVKIPGTDIETKEISAEEIANMFAELLASH